MILYICPQGHINPINTDDGCLTCGWQLEEVSDELPFADPVTTEEEIEELTKLIAE